MLSAKASPHAKRRRLRELLADGALVRMPGAFSPLVARMIEASGFEGVYVSGAALSADLGLPDIGLTTLTEVAARARQTARMTELPTLVDADTGFGEPLGVARAVQEFEDAGVAGCHIEDQVNPKRCGHLDGKQVVDLATARRRIAAAVTARRDDAFLIVARIDARATHGLAEVRRRAAVLTDAGADAIFPEALEGAEEFAAIRDVVDVPILANMTEFGKGRLLTTDQLRDIGVDMVIYPVTTLRLAMKAVEDGLRVLADQGTQASLLERMQHRSELYESLDYLSYDRFDEGIYREDT